MVKVFCSDASDGGRVGRVSEDVDAVFWVDADVINFVAAFEDGVGLDEVWPAVIAVGNADSQRGGGAEAILDFVGSVSRNNNQDVAENE